MASGSGEVDPNGWVSQPPTTLVKVQGVASRPALNGSLGVVLQYAPDRGRYTVHMAITQTQVALKAENLRKCTLLEQVQGQYQLLRHDPTVRRQVQSMYSAVQTRTGIAKPEYLAAAAMVLLVGLGYVLGVSRLLVLVSFVLLVFGVVAPDVMAGASRETVVRNAPRRYRELIRQSIPVVGNTIADSPYLSAALASFMLIVLVRSLWPAAAAATTTTRGAMPPLMPPMDPAENGGGGSSSLMTLKERYYKLGFDDATKLVPYGTSLKEDAAADGAAAAAGASSSLPDLDLSSSSSSSIPLPPGSTDSSSSSPWQYVSTAMSLFYVVNTVQQLGRDAVTGQFDVGRLQQNVAAMEPWRMGMLGFSLYRIVRAFI